jgi:nitric oxide reductase subunit B
MPVTRCEIAQASWHALVVLSALNGGLFLMFLTSLLPVGLMQTWYSYTKGFWYARSADFYDLPSVQWLGHWRIVPDIVIIVGGALPLLWFLIRTFPKLRRAGEPQAVTPAADG